MFNHRLRQGVGHWRATALPAFDKVRAVKWPTAQNARNRLVLGGARVAAIEHLREASLDFVDLEVGDLVGTGQNNREGYFVADLQVSRLRLQREQHVPGWCVLLFRRVVREPHELPETERIAFFEDMVRVGGALERVYAALKINYAIAGNSVPHLHAHIQPRYHGDPYPGGVVSPPSGQSVILTDSEARDQILRIRAALAD